MNDIDVIFNVISAFGIFFVFGRLAPNIQIAALLYAIPNLLFIYDAWDPYIQILSVHTYFTIDLALLLTVSSLVIGDRQLKEGCWIEKHTLLEEAVFRYNLLHQHCIKVFKFEW